MLEITYEKKIQQYHFWIEGLRCLITKVLKLQKGFEVFQSSFHMSNLKNWSPKKYEDEGPNM